MIEQIGGIANQVAAVVVVLGLCIYAHELGHFVVAKLSGMHVREFAFGLGPILWGFRRGETKYTIRAVPFGGLNDIAGMEPGQRDVERGFYTRPLWMGAMTIVAGVFMNLVLALLLFWGIAVFHGVPVPDSNAIMISRVVPNQPAEAAGLQGGDEIVAIDGNENSLVVASVRSDSPADAAGLHQGDWILKVGSRDISVPAELMAGLKGDGQGLVPVAAVDSTARSISEAVKTLQLPSLPGSVGETPRAALSASEEQLGLTFEPLDQHTVVRYIKTHPQQTIQFTLLRDEQRIVKTVRSRESWKRLETVTADGKLDVPHRKAGQIGVVLSPETRRAGVIEGLGYGVAGSVGAVAMLVDMIRALVGGAIVFEPAGPVGIIAMTAEQAKAGWAAVLSLGGLISANLAVINLLPLPPLDGFHLVLIGFEGILRRPISPRLEIAIRRIGIAFIMLFLVFLVLHDVTNLIQYGTP